MSATTEKLYDQIRNLESTIAEWQSAGKDTSTLIVELANCRKQLEAANNALNENRQILKG